MMATPLFPSRVPTCGSGSSSSSWRSSELSAGSRVCGPCAQARHAPVGRSEQHSAQAWPPRRHAAPASAACCYFPQAPSRARGVPWPAPAAAAPQVATHPARLGPDGGDPGHSLWDGVQLVLGSQPPVRVLLLAGAHQAVDDQDGRLWGRVRTGLSFRAGCAGALVLPQKHGARAGRSVNGPEQHERGAVQRGHPPWPAQRAPATSPAPPQTWRGRGGCRGCSWPRRRPAAACRWCCGQ